MVHSLVPMLFWLIVGHFICDYAWQGDWMSKAKNPVITLIHSEKIWPLALIGHAFIHAGAVQLVTGSYILASMELCLHAYVDYFKCKGRLGYNEDQVAHLMMKLGYACLWLVWTHAGWGAMP